MNPPFSPDALARRAFLSLGGAALAASALPVRAAQAATGAAPFVTKMDFADPKWNRDTWARLQGNVDTSQERFGHYFGVVLGVSPNERVRELVGFEGFSVTRLLRLADGSWRKLLREVVLYRDPATGKLLGEWTNPWSGEVVKVVNVANDPFNFTIGEFYPDPPSYGGLNMEKPPKRPLLLDWRLVGDDTVLLTTDIHLFYPNALRPDVWVRESSGPMAQVSEMFRYVIRREHLDDPARTSVPYHGTWNRITPWLPWMLLGPRPGHCLYVGNMTAYDSIRYVTPDVVAYVERTMPKFLTAPTEDYGPSLSSLENYIREQKPAPVKTPGG
jgi:hypothetical protein